VTKVMGRERELTREFLAPGEPLSLRPPLLPGGPGQREGPRREPGGLRRRNFLVPVPSFDSFAELNAHLEAACVVDMERSVRGKPEGKAERLEVDRAAMLSLPAESFDPRRVAQASANSLSLVRFDRNDYSVPTDFAHHEVHRARRHRGCPHPFGDRSGGPTPEVLVPKRRSPSIPALPGPVGTQARGTRPRPSPGGLGTCLHASGTCVDASRPDLGSAGTREYIKVLRLMERASIHQLTGAIEEALRMGRPGPTRSA